LILGLAIIVAVAILAVGAMAIDNVNGYFSDLDRSSAELVKAFREAPAMVLRRKRR
jgi:hypothetical protein